MCPHRKLESVLSGRNIERIHSFRMITPLENRVDCTFQPSSYVRHYTYNPLFKERSRR